MSDGCYPGVWYGFDFFGGLSKLFFGLWREGGVIESVIGCSTVRGSEITAIGAGAGEGAGSAAGHIRWRRLGRQGIGFFAAAESVARTDKSTYSARTFTILSIILYMRGKCYIRAIFMRGNMRACVRGYI